MESCGSPSIPTTSFFVLEASNVPLKLETEKNDTVNYTVETTFASYVEKDNRYSL